MCNVNDKPLNILVVCAANPAVNPRPSRLINHLKKHHKVSAIGINSSKIENVKTYSYSNPKKRTAFQEMRLYLTSFCKQYRKMVFIPSRIAIIEYIKEVNADVIICHDLLLLPIVLENKGDAKVIFDAREFYPKQLENNFRWRILFSSLMDWLCRTYLNEVDYMYTVSKGLVEAYFKEYHVSAGVIMSSSDYTENLNQMALEEKRIKLIHHGVSNENRSLHLMIEMMDYVDERFSLDLMLVCSDKEYFERLQKEASKRKNVNIIPPVEFKEIIPFLSSYDIGIFLVPPTTFNLKHCLPNKFFEFVQARLAIAIGPSIEMSRLVEKYDLGLVSQNFDPKTIAEDLNNLSSYEIKRFKMNSHQAASLLSSDEMNRKIDQILKKVCT